LQRQITTITTGNFEFRNTRSGTRIAKKEMADFSATKKYLKKIIFHIIPTSRNRKKTVNAVIRHLPLNIPAEDI
jgi:hypothetical protein